MSVLGSFGFGENVTVETNEDAAFGHDEADTP